jgi:hypothetical protein
VNCNVPVAEAINEEGVLPEHVQEALGRLLEHGASRTSWLRTCARQRRSHVSPRRPPDMEAPRP